MAQTNRQTDRQTDGHGDSMTDPAQRAESVKRNRKWKERQKISLIGHMQVCVQ